MTNIPKFMLYDGRAKLLGTEAASVMDTAYTEKEARRLSRDWKGYDAVWVEYKREGESDLFEEIFREDIRL